MFYNEQEIMINVYLFFLPLHTFVVTPGKRATILFFSTPTRFAYKVFEMG